MEDPKAVQLFQQILQKTREGRIEWSPTANESEFLTVLPGGFALVISKWDRRDEWHNMVEHMAMVLRGEDEEELLRVAPDNATITSTDFSALYESARRRALGVDAKVDKLLGDLARM